MKHCEYSECGKRLVQRSNEKKSTYRKRRYCNQKCGNKATAAIRSENRFKVIPAVDTGFDPDMQRFYLRG